MNSDEYWRNATTARAEELNVVYQQIVANNTYKHFDLAYFDCPLEGTLVVVISNVCVAVLKVWSQAGGEAWQLIEPVDGKFVLLRVLRASGFHPNQIANALTTEVMWELYEQNGLLPPANPMNDLIDKLFGDQGGYVPSGGSR